MCCYYPNLWHQANHGTGNENKVLVNIDLFFIDSNYGNKLAFLVILLFKTFTLVFFCWPNSFMVDDTRISQKKNIAMQSSKIHVLEPIRCIFWFEIRLTVSLLVLKSKIWARHVLRKFNSRKTETPQFQDTRQLLLCYATNFFAIIFISSNMSFQRTFI